MADGLCSLRISPCTGRSIRAAVIPFFFFGLVLHPKANNDNDDNDGDMGLYSE
jgi:hypothetical protein